MINFLFSADRPSGRNELC